MEPAKGREKAPPPPGPGCPLRGPLPRWRQLCRALEFLPKRPFSPPPCRLHTARRIEPQLHGFRGPSCLAPCPVSPARPTPRGSPLPQGPTPRPPPVASASRPPEEGEGSDKGWGVSLSPQKRAPRLWRRGRGASPESARFSVTSAGASGRRPGHQSPLCRSAAPAAVRGADRAGPQPPTSPGLRGTGNRPWGAGTGHTRSCEAPVRVPTPVSSRWGRGHG